MSNDSLAFRIESGLKNGFNNSEIVIPVVVSNIGILAAVLCTIFGSIINGTAMFVMLKVRKSQKHFFLDFNSSKNERFYFDPLKCATLQKLDTHYYDILIRESLI